MKTFHEAKPSDAMVRNPRKRGDEEDQRPMETLAGFEAKHDELLKAGKSKAAGELLLKTLRDASGQQERLYLASLWAHMDVVPALAMSPPPGSASYEGARACLDVLIDLYDIVPPQSREMVLDEGLIPIARRWRDQLRAGEPLDVPSQQPQVMEMRAAGFLNAGRYRDAVEAYEVLFSVAPEGLPRTGMAGMICSIYHAYPDAFDYAPGSEDYLRLRFYLGNLLRGYAALDSSEQALLAGMVVDERRLRATLALMDRDEEIL